MNKISEKKYRGQSLMESILAIGLVMSVVISSIGISIYTTRIGRSSQNRLVAYNLAREGIEYARNIRDSNWLKKSQRTVLNPGPPVEYYDWDTGLDGCSSVWCTLDYRLVSSVWTWVKTPLAAGVYINNCATCELRIDSTYFTYSLTSGTLSGFSRALKIDTSTPNILKVIVKVKWLENNQAKIITLEEDLTNWRYE
ncbi:MAG: hypothetical protein ABIH38_02955 [Patescibacteria group bacterium]